MRIARKRLKDEIQRFPKVAIAATAFVVVLMMISAYTATAAPTLPTTLCIVDDSNGNQLRFDQNTGDYLFNNCATGISFSGRGKVKIKGSIITLTHIASDRRLNVLLDQAAKKANASLMTVPGGLVRTIIDRNTANDLCACEDDDDTD